MVSMAQQKWGWWLASLLLLISSGLLIFSKDFRTMTKLALGAPEHALILSSLTLRPDQSKPYLYRFLKLSQSGEIHIQILKQTSDRSFSLSQNIVVGQGYNGEFFLQGQSTPLAAKDLTNDHIKEILVPVLDYNLRPRVAVLQLNPKTQMFFQADAGGMLSQISP